MSFSLTDAPQGSKIGPLPFNNFTHDLFIVKKISELRKFSDDNSVSTFECYVENLVKILERKDL